MRIALVAAAILCAGSWASPALAGRSHWLLANPGLAFYSKAVNPPDLTTSVEASYESGVAGVDPTWANSHAEASSDTGHLAVQAFANQAPGGTLKPSSWVLTAQMEETVRRGTPPARGMRVSLAISAADAILKGANPGTIRMIAVVFVNTCRFTLIRTITPISTSELVPTDNCINVKGVTARALPSGIDIDVDDIGVESSIGALVLVEFNRGLDFQGMFDLGLSADLQVTPTGGALDFTSPTFGSKAPGSVPDGGVGPGPDDGGTGVDSGLPDDGIAELGAPGDAGAPPSGGGGSGCGIGGGERGGSAARCVGLALAAAALLRVRRRSHRGPRRGRSGR